MAVPFETIAPEVERLRNFVLGDLKAIIEAERGGNYLVAALITCACDALALLKYGKEYKGALFFAELLPSDLRPLAPALYGAIRNGIVHSYDTRVIRIGSRRLDVVISWREKPHLHVSRDGEHIYVNLQNLAADFRDAMTRFESELRTDPKAREVFERSMRSSREIAPTGAEGAIWERCLASMPTGPNMSRR